MKEENKKKLKKLELLGYLIVTFFLVLLGINDFVALKINYGKLMLVLLMSLTYITLQITLILRSEGRKGITVNQKRDD